MKLWSKQALILV